MPSDYSLVLRVQQPAARVRGRPLAIETLPLEAVKPHIRMAHRYVGQLGLIDRVIVDHELFLVLGGGGALECEGQTLPLKAGCLLFIPPFYAHTITAGAAFDHIAVHFDLVPPREQAIERRSPYRVRFAENLEIPIYQALPPGHALTLELKSLLEHWEGDHAVSRLAAHANLLHVVAALLLAARELRPLGDAKSQRMQARLERVISYMHARFHEPLRLNTLVRVSNLKASRLSESFRGFTGYSLMQYLQRLRIAKAKELLADVDLSVKEVAAKTGFSDPYHFSRVFRTLEGVPPTTYRETIFAARGGAVGRAEAPKL
jgi:AraC-like DNA-binding protein